MRYREFLGIAIVYTITCMYVDGEIARNTGILNVLVYTYTNQSTSMTDITHFHVLHCRFFTLIAHFSYNPSVIIQLS